MKARTDLFTLRLLLAALTLAVVAGCADDPNKIKSGQVREMCFAAVTGDEIVYRFEADGVLAFNLHYHEGDEALYPVPEHYSPAEKGQFIVKQDQTYCLMWTNHNSQPVELDATVDGVEAIELH